MKDLENTSGDETVDRDANEEFTLSRQLVAEGLGTAMLLATVVGSGIMGERLSGGIVGMALMGNAVATGCILIVLILVLGPVSGGHFNPAVTLSFVIRRELTWAKALAFWGAQIIGAMLGVWLAHTGFGLPLAIYLLYSYMATLPKDIFESAAIDGASHFTTFTRLVLPLSFPALAAFAIFQFLWVWNDLLVALVFLGTGSETAVLTAQLNELVGSRGQDWHLLTAGAFVSMVVPLIVFLSLQRFFVRGLLAGSVKG